MHARRYHRRVTPLLLVACGAAALAAAVLVLRSFGPRFRVGRLLAATPRVSVGEALALARSGSSRYVRVDGRVDSEDEFEDADHRPLVLRRTRLEVREGGRWRSLVDDRRTVPFVVREGLDSVAIDRDALDAGLVVVPRESTGTAGEVPEHLPEGTDPSLPVRLRIEQLSSVEHVIVLGVPQVAGDEVVMTAGTGRPLVMTPLAAPEAIRILGGGRRRPALAGALLAAGAALLAVGIGWSLIEAVS